MRFIDRLLADIRARVAPNDRPAPSDASSDGEADAIVEQVCDEAERGPWENGSLKLGNSLRWAALKDEPAQMQIAVMAAAARAGIKGHTGQSYLLAALRGNMVSQILRRNLPFAEADLIPLLSAWSKQNSLDWGLPGKAILGAVERQAEKAPLSANCVQALAHLRKKAIHPVVGTPVNRFAHEVVNRVDRLVTPKPAAAAVLPSGDFAQQVLASLDAETRDAWMPLLLLAAEAGDKSKPSAKWQAAVKAALAGLDATEVATRLQAWLRETVPDPAYPDPSLDILKGLVWAAVVLDQGRLAGGLGYFAEVCFRKIPNIGARSVRLGNAVMWTLSEMAGEPAAAAELIRLRDKIKYPSARALIDNRLRELAGRSGQSVEALEDMSLPDFGLGPDSRAEARFGAVAVALELTAQELTVKWCNAAGQPVKSVPAEARQDAAALAVLRNRIKGIEAARAAQVVRLERGWTEDRDWSFADWRRHVATHPVRRPIAETLIWRVADGERTLAVMLGKEGLTDVTGQAPIFDAEARVRLWHPLDSETAEVLAWRERIVERGITQPIRQAHREIYVLTDAERQTRLYSNRFAAHILRQHQFRALCQARGWAYGLMGAWDGWNVPERALPAYDMRVQYQVETVDGGGRSDSYVALHVATDQVRFLDDMGRPVPLETLPPIVFSELMRDVDLFVAVTSVANDPNWTDGGPDGRHAGYWSQWAFGPLGETAETRKALIASLVPRLSIRDRLEIGDKALIVKGKRQKYAIHFGSGNIQILPANRYLCIIADRAPAEANELKLPFTGDTLLSVILSKAFLLVDESKIKDPTILRQL